MVLAAVIVSLFPPVVTFNLRFKIHSMHVHVMQTLVFQTHVYYDPLQEHTVLLHL